LASDRLKTGGFALENPDPGRAGANADIWEKVVRKLQRADAAGRTAPPDADRARAFLSALEASLDRAAGVAESDGRSRTD
jgi:hypothetical protein